MKIAATAATFVDPTYLMKYYGTILDLVSYPGHVQLHSNIFKTNAL